MAQLKERPKPFLLPDYCKGCGRCISACAKGCITLGEEIDSATGYVPVRLNLENCNGCGLCMDACPEPYGLRETPADVDFELQDPAKLFGGKHSTAPAAVDIPAVRVPLPRTEPLVIKGNYASAIGALLAGCRHVFGYPITPSTEGAELMAKLLPKLDGCFLQAVSEVATVNHMYGSGGAGRPCMTFTSSPGLQPDAGRHLLHDRRRGAGRLRQHHARRPGPGQHRPRAGRRQAGLPRPGPRQHPRHHPHAQHPPGNARPDHAGLRTDLQVPQPGGAPGRRLPGPDDRQGRRCPTP